jgi:hypothetical protein
MLTTLLACGWGLASAYTLLHSLLITHNAQPCLAALVPLVAVWATLERKRWGRLALLGLSATALGLFVTLTGLVAASASKLPEAEHNFARYTEIALGYFNHRPEIALTVLGLALTTGFWMRRPVVVAEFERGKRATLAVAQKAIAMSLVGFWGVTVLLAPLPGQKDNAQKEKKPEITKPDKPAPPHSGKRNSKPDKRQRNNRDALPASNV